MPWLCTGPVVVAKVWWRKNIPPRLRVTYVTCNSTPNALHSKSRKPYTRGCNANRDRGLPRHDSMHANWHADRACRGQHVLSRWSGSPRLTRSSTGLPSMHQTMRGCLHPLLMATMMKKADSYTGNISITRTGLCIQHIQRDRRPFHSPTSSGPTVHIIGPALLN
jgi:hypothetical protein